MGTIPWAGPALHVIGLGVDPRAPLHPEASAAVDRADVIIGGKRHLAAFPYLTAERVAYPNPMSRLVTVLQNYTDKRIALLASGDPLLFGIGDYLLRHFVPEKLIFHPNVSSIQTAFARVRKPWQRAEILSLHGRSIDLLKANLRVNRLYGLLTDNVNHPATVAHLLCSTGFEESRLWVAEDLGSDRERINAFRADALAKANPSFSPLNVVVLETRGAGDLLPEFPGIPDERFVTDADEPGKGMLSKREVRLTILSLIEPRAGEIGWDIGAGCGGVSVEWARWNPEGRVYAVECHDGRLECLAANQRRFGVVANLQMVAGQAPGALVDLPSPDAIFVGGSNGCLAPLLETCWNRLNGGGRLVVAAVTEDSRVDLHRFSADKPTRWTELSVARGETLAGQRIMRPHLPVLLAKLDRSPP